MLNRILAVLAREPVRVRGYLFAAAVLGVLVYHGVIDADAVPIYLAPAAVLLGIGAIGAVESTRAKVTPTATANQHGTYREER